MLKGKIYGPNNLRNQNPTNQKSATKKWSQFFSASYFSLDDEV
jgi:hypothetical protein